MSGTSARSAGAAGLAAIAILFTGCAGIVGALGFRISPELQENGIPAPAEILELWDTGWSINDSPVVGLKVRVMPADRPPFEARIEKTVISRLAVSQVQPGNVIAVRFDAQNPTVVAVDPEPPEPQAKASTGNPYRDEFSPVRQVGLGVLPGPEEPQLFLGTSDSAADAQALYENHYALLGAAGVHGGEDLRQALEQGREVGAALVVVYGRYAQPPGMTLEVLPYRPRPTAPGAAAPAHSLEIFSHRGPEDRVAAYWGKTPRPILGILTRPHPGGEPARPGHGVVVDAVAGDSPAADAGLAAGDVIVAIDGEPIDDSMAIPELLQSRAGKAVRIQFERNGSAMATTAQLNPGPP